MTERPYLQVSEIDQLRNPILIAAFEGWNDAGEAATFALTTLVRAWHLQPFGTMDPEEFYVFTDTRPSVSLSPEGTRSLQWPENTFYAYAPPEAERDLVLLIGTEPDLRWPTFSRTVLGLAERLNVSMLITLGALLADVPHTADVRVTGYATDPAHLPQLEPLGVGMSTYEGPTGIVGVLQHAWQESNRPGISLWGNVPHYISAVPNPEVSLALLKRLSGLVGMPMPTRRLQSRAESFRSRIDEALADNPEAVEYVKQLEEQYGSDVPGVPSPELIQELEEYLRNSRPPEPPEID